MANTRNNIINPTSLNAEDLVRLASKVPTTTPEFTTACALTVPAPALIPPGTQQTGVRAT